MNVVEQHTITHLLVATSNSFSPIEDEKTVALGKLTTVIVMVGIHFPIVKSYVGIATNALSSARLQEDYLVWMKVGRRLICQEKKVVVEVPGKRNVQALLRKEKPDHEVTNTAQWLIAANDLHQVRELAFGEAATQRKMAPRFEATTLAIPIIRESNVVER